MMGFAEETLPRDSFWSWFLVLLAAAVVGGMVLTLWAGLTGRIRSRHGIEGSLDRVQRDMTLGFVDPEVRNAVMGRA